MDEFFPAPFLHIIHVCSPALAHQFTEGCLQIAFEPAGFFKHVRQLFDPATARFGRQSVQPIGFNLAQVSVLFDLYVVIG